jgi:TolB-like protein
MIWFALLLCAAFAGEHTLAIVAFENNSPDPRLDAMGRGLQYMLITDLVVADEIDVVERDEISAILDELALADTGFLDPKTAVRAGRGVGATVLLTGSIVSANPILRIDARLIDMETGKILFTRKVEGPEEEWFFLEKELAGLLIESLGVVLDPREQARLGRTATEDLDAFLALSDGLAALDRGEVAAAQAALTRALAADDGFALAEDLIKQLRQRFADAGLERKEATLQRLDTAGDPLETLLEALPDDPKRAREIPAALAPWTAMRWSEMTPRCATLTEQFGALLALEVQIRGRVDDVDFGTVSAEAFVLAHHVMCSREMGRHAEVATWGAVFVERFPGSPYIQQVETTARLSLYVMAGEQNGPAVAEWAAKRAHARRLREACSVVGISTPADLSDYLQHRCRFHGSQGGWFARAPQLQACRELAQLAKQRTCPADVPGRWLGHGLFDPMPVQAPDCFRIDAKVYEYWRFALESAELPYAPDGTWELDVLGDSVYTTLLDTSELIGGKTVARQDPWDPENPNWKIVGEQLQATQNPGLAALREAMAQTFGVYQNDRFFRCGGFAYGCGYDWNEILHYTEPAREKPEPSKGRPETVDEVLDKAWDLAELGRAAEGAAWSVKHLKRWPDSASLHANWVTLSLYAGDGAEALAGLEAWERAAAHVDRPLSAHGAKAVRGDLVLLAAWNDYLLWQELSDQLQFLAQHGAWRLAGQLCLETLKELGRDAPAEDRAWLLYQAALKFHDGLYVAERDAALLRLIRELPETEDARSAWGWAQELPTQPLEGSGLMKPPPEALPETPPR